MFACIEGGLGAVTQAQLGEDIGHMVFDSALGDEESFADLAVGGAFGN